MSGKMDTSLLFELFYTFKIGVVGHPHLGIPPSSGSYTFCYFSNSIKSPTLLTTTTKNILKLWKTWKK
jgi:hypothetical protein